MKRCILLGVLAAVVTFAWRRHRRWVHEFDEQET